MYFFAHDCKYVVSIEKIFFGKKGNICKQRGATLKRFFCLISLINYPWNNQGNDRDTFGNFEVDDDYLYDDK